MPVIARGTGLGSGRKSNGGHTRDSVPVGRRYDRRVRGRLLGLWKVDRPECVAVRREEGDARTHVHGRGGVLPRQSIRALGIPVQERRGPRADSRSVHRDHVRLAPALLWIIGGNFFIGWLQDYGAMMLSVRKEGRSFGPITYEFTGARGRTNLLAFVLFYLIIISAAFIALIASFWNAFPGTFVATVGILVAGLLCGQLLYRVKMNVFAVTGIGLALVIFSIYLGVAFPITLAFGVWNVPIWAFVAAVILYAAAVLRRRCSSSRRTTWPSTRRTRPS